MVLLFITIVGLVGAIDLYALQQWEIYYDHILLQKISPDDCLNFQSLGSQKYDNYYSERYITADTDENIVYTIGLLKNDTMPAGPFFPWLLGLDGTSGVMKTQLKLPLAGSYLGLESYALESDSDLGQIFVIGKFAWPTNAHILIIIDVKNDYKITNYGAVFDEKYRIIASTYDYDAKILYVACSDKIYEFDVTNPLPSSSFTDDVLVTLDYDSASKRVYGVGLNTSESESENGYMEQGLYYFSTKDKKLGSVGTVGKGYDASMYGVSTLDEKNRVLYVFVGDSQPHVGTSYNLFGLDLKDGSTVTQCSTSSLTKSCCTAILSSPICP